MSHTRAALDHKISQLEARAKELGPRQLTQRYMPEYFVDRVIGGVLTLVGISLAWSMYRRRAERRESIRAAMGGYSQW